MRDAQKTEHTVTREIVVTPNVPPVIESEILRNDIGGWTDTTQCPPSLIEDLREIHA